MGGESARTSGPNETDPVERSIPFAEVMEAEFREISEEAPDPPLPWEFDAAQILQPDDLRTRLIERRDPVARGLADRELKPLVLELVQKGPPKSAADFAALQTAFATAFNALLEQAEFYQAPAVGSPTGEGAGSDTAARFAGLRFRSQTRECIALGPIRERNRLILEDAFPEIQSRDDARLARVFARAHKRKFAALCLSGGGIRSASFGLGILQGLSQMGLLGRFHYLSTVSGGGYIGGWLSAWMHRAGRDRVLRDLAEPTGRPFAPEPPAIAHIRANSRYLSPRVGMMSTDTWTLAAIYIRNLLLNWMVLVPILGAALVPHQLLIALTRLPQRQDGEPIAVAAWAYVLLMFMIIAFAVMSVRYVHANRPIKSAKAPGSIDDPRRDHRAFNRWCFLPMLAAVVGLTVIWAWVAAGKVPMLGLPDGARHWRIEMLAGESLWTFHAAWAWAGGGVFVHLSGWLLAGRGRSWREFLFVLLTGALGGLAAGMILHGLAPSASMQSTERLEQYAFYVSFATPALLATFLVFGHVFIGITSRNQEDPMFEWTARYSAWLQIAIFAWLAACGVIVLAPLGFGWLFSQIASTEAIETSLVVAGLVGVGAGAATLRQAYTAPLALGGRRVVRAGLWARLVGIFALPFFVIALLTLLSFFVDWLTDLPGKLSPYFFDKSCAVPDSGSPDIIYLNALTTVACGSVQSSLLVFVALVGGAYLLSLRIDTNRFSLHGMYRARLIRTFFGASRAEQERNPNRFTGFDECDDIAFADLRRSDRPAPFHLVNAALNLVTRDELAAQDRQAVSFTFSPLHCGSAQLGYRPTRGYGGGLTLGTAVTISGAAASPEMGYQSKPLLSFLLTLFNVRLGWWLGNPGYSGREHFRDTAPASSLTPIIDEALGRTDDRNAYAYLTDGGHFENLGLYEMVLRRCHWIVVSDAGCDPQGAFEDLGNAIRRIRVDFGIPITFEKVPIYSRDDAGAQGPDATYCAIGRIGYSEMDGDVEDGTLIYIKPAFYGTEPPDVFNYAQTSPTFPHESTANQFFTEAQFESYRRLGRSILEHIAPPPAASASAPASEPGADDPRHLSIDAFAARVKAGLE